jgi:hypothetical protein
MGRLDCLLLGHLACIDWFAAESDQLSNEPLLLSQ